MIDTSIEQAVPLSVAARQVPNRKGKRGICAATIWRWAMKGIKGIRLETIMVGGMRMTTDEAMQRFYVATTAAASGAPIPARTPAARKRAMRAAERELEEEGL